MTRYRYQFLGDYACSTARPNAEWAPGEIKWVDQPIVNDSFRLLGVEDDAPVPAPAKVEPPKGAGAPSAEVEVNGRA